VIGGVKRRYALILGVNALYIFLFFGWSLASGGGGHGEAQENGQLLDLIYRVINFGLLVVILFVVLRKVHIGRFFSARRDEIKKKLDDLSREKEAAESRYRDLEESLREFETKKAKIIQQLRSEGLAEKEKIIAEAEEKARQILDKADLTIEREILAAKDRLREEVMNLAARKAREIITKEIKDSDQDQLVNDFIERVEKLH
jgi:F-type H+-transporting ATPase subunit b